MTPQVHPTCTWSKCTRCKARVDTTRHRGYLPTPTIHAGITGSQPFTYDDDQ